MPTPSDMFINDAQMRHAAAGYIGAKTGILAGIAAEAPVMGIMVGPYVNRHGVSNDRPVAITRLTLSFLPGTAFSAEGGQGLGFEIHVTNVTTNFTGGSPITVLAQRKKTSGYDAIPESEIDIKASNTAALSGGNHVLKQAEDAPWFFAAGSGTLPVINHEWVADDGKPLVLQRGEGLLVHNVIAMGASGAGTLWLGADFFRL